MNDRQHRLLVVDDEPDLRTLYELTLLREGYDIETAATVEEAELLLRWLEEPGTRLVRLDGEWVDDYTMAKLLE